MSKLLKEPRTQKIMNKFAAEHLPLLKSAVRKLKAGGMIPPEWDPKDVHNQLSGAFQEALWGAMHKYDPEAFGGKEFRHYAGPAILGHLQKHLKDLRKKKGDDIPQFIQQKAKRQRSLEAQPVKQIISQGQEVQTPASQVPEED